MQSEHSSSRLKVILAFAAIYVIWGSTFFGVSIALKSFPPFLLSALRLLIAVVVVSLGWGLGNEQNYFDSIGSARDYSLWRVVCEYPKVRDQHCEVKGSI